MQDFSFKFDENIEEKNIPVKPPVFLPKPPLFLDTSNKNGLTRLPNNTSIPKDPVIMLNGNGSEIKKVNIELIILYAFIKFDN